MFANPVIHLAKHARIHPIQVAHLAKTPFILIVPQICVSNVILHHLIILMGITVDLVTQTVLLVMEVVQINV